MSDRVEVSSHHASRRNPAVVVETAPSALSGLEGRVREQGELDRLFADARRGLSGCLVVRGEAGMGKTALLGYAGERAEGFTVLRTSGIEAEYDLAFAGLHGPPSTASARCRSPARRCSLGARSPISPPTP
jgi:AAA ATPase-like protein